jgi:acyl-CoA dehydrogenase
LQNTLEIAPADGPADEPATLSERLEAVCDIARIHADAVDAQGRFPQEAMDALKRRRLLGVMIPRPLGGEGLGLGEVADLCFKLGRACSSTAMIFAMHQVKVACLVRHHGDAPWQLEFLRKVAAQQLLLGSSTTEGAGGGAVRRSSAPVKRTASGVTLTRCASVISYGEEADAIVTTARRDSEAATSDQVLVVFQRQDYRLERTSDWDAMGMRGTCSHAFMLEATGRPEQVLPVAYAEIHAQTMTAHAHALWGSAWAGVAAEAVERARLYLRRATRSGSAAAPPGARHLAEAKASLQTLCTLLAGFIDRYERVKDAPADLTRVDMQSAISMLKIEVSDLAVRTVMSALRTCGLSGYRNGGEFSVGRLLRDALSAPLMISNDRILADLAGPALLDRGPRDITGRSEP